MEIAAYIPHLADAMPYFSVSEFCANFMVHAAHRAYRERTVMQSWPRSLDARITQLDPRLVGVIRELGDRALALCKESLALNLQAEHLRETADALMELLPTPFGSTIRSGVEQVGPPRASLSARQTEVAELVAQGLTNRHIAERLVVSERTVETHLERIFVRLDIASRAQLAAWITEQDALHRLLALPPRSTRVHPHSVK